MTGISDLAEKQQDDSSRPRVRTVEMAKIFCGLVAVRMLERQPGMVSRICESFKGLHLMVAGSFHDARTEDQPLMPVAESDTRSEKSVSAHGGTFHQRPTAIRVESINDTLPRDGQREPIA